MDSDRKSNISSFYHGRKSSTDALNLEVPRVSTSAVERGNHPRDDVSSFYNPDRSSLDRLNDTRMTSGYNRGSYFPPGREEPVKGGKDEREEEEAWDVYADFNNAGPRYSNNTTLGQATSNG